MGGNCWVYRNNERNSCRMRFDFPRKLSIFYILVEHL